MRAVDMFLKDLLHARSGSSGQDEPSLDNALAELLGCPFQTGDLPVFENNDSVADDVARARRDQLPFVLRILGQDPEEPSDGTSILVGLKRSDVWQEFVYTEDDAYLLAGHLLDFVDAYWPAFDLDLLAAPYIVSMLNAWVNPVPPWSSIPTVHSVCRAMFGDPWCTLVLPDDKGRVIDKNGFTEAYAVIRSLVVSQRPPFKVGMCQAQINVFSVPLPELSCDALEVAP